MNSHLKKFNELSVTELYKIVTLRNQVFVVEQNCAYLDTDDYDQEAYHILIWHENVLVAYARIIKPGVKYTNSSIGRVVVNQNHRKLNLGHLLMTYAVKAVNELFKNCDITISAQAHLQHFYNKHGFETISDEYLEDNIPHVEMVRNHTSPLFDVF